MSDELISLERQLAEKKKNLRVIQEAMARFVLSTDIPLQLVKEKEELEADIQSLKQRLAEAPPGPAPTALPIPAFTGADLLARLTRPKPRIDDNDLHTIIFSLGRSYDEFGGPHTPTQRRLENLIEDYERRDDLATLIAAIRRLRPDLAPLLDALERLPGPTGTSRDPSPTAPTPTALPPVAPSTQAPTTPSYATVFISYSSKDEAFARRLYDDLKARGVRVFFAPEDLPIGAKIRDTLHQKIVEYDKLLLILSQHSVTSAWVEDEVERAFERERRDNPLVLFPIRLDDTVLTATQAWAETIHDTRNIGDFTRWTDPAAYQAALARLLRDLQPSP